MLNINKNREKGISLVEVLLIVALVAIIVMAGFRFWENKRIQTNTSQTVAMTLQLAKSIRGALVFANQDQFNAATLNNASLNAIVSGALEEKYKDGNKFITPIGELTVAYGGLLIPNASINQLYGVNLTFSSVNAKSCSLFVTSQLKNGFSQMRVNNAVTVNLKNNNIGTDISLLTGACATGGNNNTIRLDMPLNEIFSTEDTIITEADAYVRGQDSVAYLGSVLNSGYTGSQTCTGGAYWDTASNKCGCPVNSRWMGASLGCVGFNSTGTTQMNKAGVCNLNDGLGQSGNCEVLNPSLPVASGTYVNGKHLPTHSFQNGTTGTGTIAPNNVETPQVNTVIDVPASVEEIGGRSISSTALTTGSSYTSVCLTGTQTNGRCAPPATPLTGNW